MTMTKRETVVRYIRNIPIGTTFTSKDLSTVLSEKYTYHNFSSRFIGSILRECERDRMVTSEWIKEDIKQWTRVAE